MGYEIKRKKIAEISRELVSAAMGRDKADLVIRGGKLVNVNTAEILPNTDIAIKYGRVICLGKVDHTVGDETQIIDATGYYLAPGFLDGHVHVESSMLTVSEFAKAVIPSGTTTIFMDPHEIANVLGMEGVKLMVAEGRNLPLKVYATAPSCVPAAPGFEDAGAYIGPGEIKELMTWDRIVGLGEMMNFPGVLASDQNVHAELKETLEAGKVITGHYSIPETEIGLPAYAASGASSCHESTRPEDALAKMRLGMYAMLREGSAWHDIKATIKSVTETRIDARHCILVTDDTHPETLLNVGHLNHVVKRAIEEGLDPIRAIQMVTINVAEYFKVSDDLGSISPGKCADILFIRDLAAMQVEKVMVDGTIVAENGKLLVELPKINYPDFVKHSVHLKSKLSPADFVIHCPQAGAKAKVRVIGAVEAQVGTKHLELELPVDNQTIPASAAQDVAKVACIERHRGTGTIGLGLVKGFGLKAGAVASTVAHDSHNLLIMGMNDDDMALAGNTLAACGGGMVAVKNGVVLALLPLSIAGLMSDEPVEKVHAQLLKLEQAWRELGCTLVSPFMTMALLALPVLPELRITNRGLVDTLNFKFVDLIV